MDDIDQDREQKKEQLESDTRDVIQEQETRLFFELPSPHKDKPASWKEISDASDKGFGYKKDGRDSPSLNEMTNKDGIEGLD